MLFSLLWTGCILFAQAQEDTTQIAPAGDTVLAKPKNTLTLGVSYANNASYYGQKSEEKTPYIAAVASYRLKSGFYFTGSAFRLLNDSAKLASASSLGIGYGFKLGKKWVADINYNHTFYPAYSPFLQAANNNTASASLNYNYFLTSGISVDYAFGKQDDIFATFTTGKEIELGNLFSKDGVSIAPSVEIVGGTQRFYQTYVDEKNIRDSLLGLIVPPLLGGGGSTNTTTTEVSTSFDLLSYNFKLPLSYYRSKYLLELSYQLSVLSNKAQTGAGSVNSFVNISFYYQF
jgi:hypothetical protein